MFPILLCIARNETLETIGRIAVGKISLFAKT